MYLYRDLIHKYNHKETLHTGTHTGIMILMLTNKETPYRYRYRDMIHMQRGRHGTLLHKQETWYTGPH